MNLKYAKYEWFDSPDSKGSAIKHMQYLPMAIIDDIMREHQMWRPVVLMGFATKAYADMRGLLSFSPHRTGHAVALKAKNRKKKFFIVKELVLRGVKRIGIGEHHIYFDTDSTLLENGVWIDYSKY